MIPRPKLPPSTVAEWLEYFTALAEPLAGVEGAVALCRERATDRFFISFLVAGVVVTTRGPTIFAACENADLRVEELRRLGLDSHCGHGAPRDIHCLSCEAPVGSRGAS